METQNNDTEVTVNVFPSQADSLKPFIKDRDLFNQVADTGPSTLTVQEAHVVLRALKLASRNPGRNSAEQFADLAQEVEESLEEFHQKNPTNHIICNRSNLTVRWGTPEEGSAQYRLATQHGFDSMLYDFDIETEDLELMVSLVKKSLKKKFFENPPVVDHMTPLVQVEPVASDYDFLAKPSNKPSQDQPSLLVGHVDAFGLDGPYGEHIHFETREEAQAFVDQAEFALKHYEH